MTLKNYENVECFLEWNEYLSACGRFISAGTVHMLL